MKPVFLIFFLFVVFSSYYSSALCQNLSAHRDSVMQASIKRIQLKLGLSDEVAGKLTAAETSMAKALDSLKTVRPLNSENSGATIKRIKERYHAQLQAILTLAQWTQYQQMEAAARDSFYLRMRGKKTPVKELDPRN
jgi:hypothetical protein